MAIVSSQMFKRSNVYATIGPFRRQKWEGGFYYELPKVLSVDTQALGDYSKPCFMFAKNDEEDIAKIL